MPASIALFEDEALTTPFHRVQLSDMEIVEGIGEGHPVQIWAHIDGTSHLREVEIALAGDGAENVQLAIDDEGKPAVWSAEGILVNGGKTVFAGEKFCFWARAIYDFGDREGSLPFEFSVKAKAIG